MTDREAIAASWAHYGSPAVLDPARIGYGELVHTPLEHFYVDLFERMGTFRSALDVGCGNGQKLVLLAERGQIARGTGIDISGPALAGGERLIDFLGIHGLELRQEAFDEHVPDRAYDLIIALQFVNYLPEPGDFFRVVRGWIRPGGTVVVAEAQRPAPLINRIRRRARRTLRRPVQPDGVHHHAAEEVLGNARAAGFRLLEASWSCRAVASLLVSFTYPLERHRFRREVTRRAAMVLHRLLTWLWAAEDSLRRGPGAWYGYVLRAPDDEQRQPVASLSQDADVSRGS